MIQDSILVCSPDPRIPHTAKPRNTIRPFITKLTSITNEDVATAESFPAVGDAFIRFMQQHANKYEDNKEAPQVENIFLVGNNGEVFNIPFLIYQLSEHGIADRLFQDGRFGLGIDTLNVAYKGICNNKSGIGVPLAYNLPTLYQFFIFLGTQDTNVFLISQKEKGKFMLPQGRLK
jgi:hypothetical protein